MTAEQARAKIDAQKAIAELGARSRIAVAEFNGKVQMRGQDIQKFATEAKDRNSLTAAMIQIDKEISKVEEGIGEEVTDAIMADVAKIGLKGAERDNYIKEQTQRVRKARAATLKSLRFTQSFIRDRLVGGFGLRGAPPSAKSGFSNLSTTSK